MTPIANNKREVATLLPYRFVGGELQIFLQKRSLDAKRIPGWYGFFGGGLESDESPEQAMLREIGEELEFKPAGYKFFSRFESANSINNVFVLSVDDNFEESVYVREGQYGRFLPLSQTIVEPKLTDLDKLVLKHLAEYFKSASVK